MQLRLFLLSLALVACGDKGGDTDDTSAGTAETGTSDPSGSSSGATDTPTTDTPTTDTPTTGGDLCADPTMTEFGPEVTVSLRNNTDAPRFVDKHAFCTEVPPFELSTASDEPVRLWRADCDFSCETVLTVGDCGCALGCGGVGETVQIDPGAVFEVKWSGASFVTVDLDPSCPAAGCDPQCTAKVQTAPGMYRVRVASSDMVANCDTCTCTPGPEGWCVVEGERGGAAAVAEAMLDYPNQTALEVVLE